MSVTTEKTVRELALEIPAATRIFERLHIDYCCGGNRSLDEACRSAGVAIDSVLASLEAPDQTPASDRDWTTEPLGELIEHICATHHAYTRGAIARIPQLLNKVCSVHGANHAELFQIQGTFDAMAQELATHLMKEEMMLFPYILRLEAAAGNGPIAHGPFGSVRNPVSMMEHEHDSAGNALRAMNAATNGYSAPVDGCVSYQTLYQALAVFEADLHQHIHLENNILFPRAVALETQS